MNILEKEIEDIVAHSSADLLNDRGLLIQKGSMRYSQLGLGSYGIADIVTFRLEKNLDICHEHHFKQTNRTLHVNVYELKKDEVNIATLLQALDYCKGIERTLDKILYNHEIDVEFEITLIGKKIESKSSFCFMPDFFKNLSIYTYNIDLEKGITFKSESGYSQLSANENLPEKLYTDNITLDTVKLYIENQVSTKKYI